MFRTSFHVSHVVAASLLLSAMALPALADPNSAIMNAVIATSRQPSYHISMTGPGIGTAEGDVVNPGKMHMIMKEGETIIVRPDMYMKMGGKWKKIAGAGDALDQAKPPAKLLITFDVAKSRSYQLGGTGQLWRQKTINPNYRVDLTCGA